MQLVDANFLDTSDNLKISDTKICTWDTLGRQHSYSSLDLDSSLFLDLVIGTKTRLLKDSVIEFERSPTDSNGLKKHYHTDRYDIDEHYSEIKGCKPLDIRLFIRDTQSGNFLDANFEIYNRYGVYAIKDFYLFAKDEEPIYLTDPFPDPAYAARKLVKFFPCTSHKGGCGCCSDCECDA